MRNLFFIILLFADFISKSQITGKVFNEYDESVEFATILNKTTNASSITNKNGVFQLSGNVGDSILIQHVNYKTKDFRVKKISDNYRLLEKNYSLGEVVVSANYAARLFELSCRKTYDKLKDENISRGYLRKMVVVEKDTTQLIDIDLDIVQKKQKSFNQKDKILPYKIQERIVEKLQDSAKLNLRLNIFPEFNMIAWDKFEKYFNYFEIQDSQFIKLYFLNKKSFQDSITHIEVKIQKSDSCLYSFAMISKNRLKNRKGETLKMQTKIIGYTRFDYKDGFSYLLDNYKAIFLTNSETGRKDITAMQFFKTYNNGAANLEKRPNGRRIFDNEITKNLIKNKYEEEFWENDSYLEYTNYDFDKLLNLNFSDSE
jgi:hypothetical protein